MKSPGPQPWGAHDRLLALLLALLTLVIYLPACQHGFTSYDDNDYVTRNFQVQKGLTWPGVQWAFTTYFASNWHPLTWLSHMLDCELFGLDAGAHHLVSAVFHAGNTVLLLVFLRRLTGTTWTAAIIAALFAWHPLRVESVAWVSERKDVLSTGLELISLCCYLRYAGEKRARYFYLALAGFALSLLAKPMPVTLPCLLLVLDWWPLQRLAPRAQNWLSLVLEKWPFFLLAAASCVVTFLAQSATAVQSLAQDPLSMRLGNAMLAYAQYLILTVWPVNLAVIYPLPDHLSWLQVLAAAAGLAGISGIAWRLRHAHPYLLAGWLWYLGTLVPVIGLVQVGKQALADRYTYFPQIGILLAVVLGVKALATRLAIKPLPLALGTGLLLALSIGLTERQLSFWRDDETLFSHALALTQNNAVAHIGLGMAREQTGRPDDAIRHYEQALAIDPDSMQAHNNLANLLDDAGQTQSALAHYQAALRLNPNAPLTHCNFGTLLVKQGRFDEAMQQYREALRLQPGYPHAHYLMGKALLRHGQSGEAIGEFRHALQLDDNDFQSRTLLAQILATDDNPARRDGPAAVALAEQANALTGGTQPLVLDVLAMAYAETRRFSEARQTATAALQLAEAAHSALATDIRQHLQQYQSSQPCRTTFTNTLPPGNVP